MKIQLLKLSLLFAVICCLFACRKDETIPLPDPAPAKMVRQIIASPNDFVTYEYDAMGNVIKYTSQWENGTGGISRLNNAFDYSDNKLMKFTNEAGHAIFTYNGSVVAKSDNFAANGKKLSTILYQYDESGRLASLIEQISNPEPDAASETKVSYQYYSNGNVSRIDFAYRKQTSEPFVVSFSKVFVEYDNKKNPEPDGVLGFFLPKVILQKNNPIKINNVLPNGTIEGYSRYEYNYNSEGYPVKRKHFMAIGSNEQTPVSFDYIY